MVCSSVGSVEGYLRFLCFTIIVNLSNLLLFCWMQLFRKLTRDVRSYVQKVFAS